MSFTKEFDMMRLVVVIAAAMLLAGCGMPTVGTTYDDRPALAFPMGPPSDATAENVKETAEVVGASVATFLGLPPALGAGVGGTVATGVLALFGYGAKKRREAEVDAAEKNGAERGWDEAVVATTVQPAIPMAASRVGPAATGRQP